jgi:fatty acid desaturase
MRHDGRALSRYKRRVLPTRVEWPTLGVAGCLAIGFGALLVWHDRLPAAAVVAGLAVLAAWYNSLQHEVIHGHPTPWRALNIGLVSLPLGLVVPFSWYRRTHLQHHRDEQLTDPDLDPESFYVSPAEWAVSGPVRRAVLWTLRTLPGRMLLGPPVLAGRLLVAAATMLRERPLATAARLARHLAGVAAVLGLVAASGLDVRLYVVAAAWLGWSISLLRSFAEHRYVDAGARSAVVRAGPAASLLFLNNNLHLTHHLRPGVPWYELPALHERLGADALAASGAGLYSGYGEVARRFLVRPFCQPVHPGLSGPPGLRISPAAG